MQDDATGGKPIRRCVTVEAARSAAERIAAALENAEPPPDAIGLFETANGRCEVWAHYSGRFDPQVLQATIAEAADGEPVTQLRIAPINAKDWVTESQRLRGPVRAGRFLVHGRHDREAVSHGRCTIEIDAGLAFGTAHHATTRGCLLALDRLLKIRRPRTVLDIGTGTGILAIAAAKALPQARVLASDNDPVAASIARANARKNGAGIEIIVADGFEHPDLRRRPADLICANLLLGPLLDLAPDFARAAARGGFCLLSGLLAGQARQVEARYRAGGFMLERRIVLDGWATLLLARHR